MNTVISKLFSCFRIITPTLTWLQATVTDRISRWRPGCRNVDLTSPPPLHARRVSASDPNSRRTTILPLHLSIYFLWESQEHKNFPTISGTEFPPARKVGLIAGTRIMQQGRPLGHYRRLVTGWTVSYLMWHHHARLFQSSCISCCEQLSLASA
jgi:hypothetical protein